MPLIGYLDDEPFAYFEVYWSKEDRLGPCCDAHDFDRGFHMAVGDQRFRFRGLGKHWFLGMAHFLFLDDPRTMRLVGEPRVDQDRVRGWAQTTPWRVVADRARNDPVLAERHLTVLRDLAGMHCPHPAFARVAGAPYRYHEMLGAVWRESAAGKLGPGQRVVPCAALFQCDLQSRPLLAEYVRGSGMTAERWLAALFDRVVVPLYHLMCRYGMGIVAHGQNIGLILAADRPHGMVLKDFHGDVRLGRSSRGSARRSALWRPRHPFQVAGAAWPLVMAELMALMGLAVLLAIAGRLRATEQPRS